MCATVDLNISYVIVRDIVSSDELARWTPFYSLSVSDSESECTICQTGDLRYEGSQLDILTAHPWSLEDLDSVCSYHLHMKC